MTSKTCPVCYGTMIIESYPDENNKIIKKLVCMTCQYGEPYEENGTDDGIYYGQNNN